MRKHKKLWNDLPDAERKRLMPHQIESQIIHIRQCREVAVRNHKRQLEELDEWIKSLDRELSRYNVYSIDATARADNPKPTNYKQP